MSIPQAIKDRVKVKLEGGHSHQTESMGTAVHIVRHDPDDSTVQVRINDQWVSREAALELSVFFKKLAKKLAAS